MRARGIWTKWGGGGGGGGGSERNYKEREETRDTTKKYRTANRKADSL